MLVNWLWKCIVAVVHATHDFRQTGMERKLHQLTRAAQGGRRNFCLPSQTNHQQRSVELLKILEVNCCVTFRFWVALGFNQCRLCRSAVANLIFGNAQQIIGVARLV